jgi:hypothetical protein
MFQYSQIFRIFVRLSILHVFSSISWRLKCSFSLFTFLAVKFVSFKVELFWIEVVVLQKLNLCWVYSYKVGIPNFLYWLSSFPKLYANSWFCASNKLIFCWHSIIKRCCSTSLSIYNFSYLFNSFSGLWRLFFQIFYFHLPHMKYGKVLVSCWQFVWQIFIF